MTRLIVTFFGAGLLRPGPGTWGTLAALPPLYLLHIAGGFPLVAAATVAVFALGWWATAIETAGAAEHDPSEIVIDEVAGIWLALWPVSAGAWRAGADILALYPGWILAFAAFRVFDISKIWPVALGDRRHDALGVMLDDVIAGAMAALVVIAGAALYHGVLT